MGKGPDYDHHIARARTEMDCAYRARDGAAAMAHMKLSALHMDRARLARASNRSDEGRTGAGLRRLSP
jgi:hypothetical protein